MTGRLDSLFKNIWLVNGILLLLILIIGTFIAIFSFVFSGNSDDNGIIVGQKKIEADKSNLELQTIEFSTPQKILKSDIYVLFINQKDYQTPRVNLSGSYESYSYDEGHLNIIFMDQKKGVQKLLLDQKALISSLVLPSDSLQKHIFYAICLDDTDGNGRINSNDKVSYYISNLDGSGFKKLPLDKYKIKKYEFSPDYKSIYLVCAVISDNPESKEEHWENRFLEYNIEANKIIENKELNTLLAKAKEILVK